MSTATLTGAAAESPRLQRGWRLLGLVWAVVLVLVIALALTLEFLGPPAPMAAGGSPGEAAHPATETKAPAAASGRVTGEHAPTAAGPATGHEPVPLVQRPTTPPPRPAERPPAPAGNDPLATLQLPAPDEALQERSPRGFLPAIAADGRRSRSVYARPFDQADPRPRVAVIIDGMGLSDTVTEAWIARLAPGFTLAFSPYGRRLPQHAEAARLKGFETLLGIPLEPVNYPLNDPGPMALLTFEPWGVNRDRLHWALTTLRGMAGTIGAIGGLRGERYSAAREAIGPVIDELDARGLFFVDARAGGVVARPSARAVDVVIDEPAVRSEIEAKLAALERLATERGAAIGIVQPRPVVLDVLAGWAGGLAARRIALAPVSAVMPPAPTALAPIAPIGLPPPPKVEAAAPAKPAAEASGH